MPSSGKSPVASQFGALCWREKDGKVQVLLVTSRRTGRWIIPKGWPMEGETPSRAALTEAEEEGGVDGKVKAQCLGLYSYTKHPDLKDPQDCVVAVYPVKVRRLKSRWPEQAERDRKWFSQKKAAKEVDEVELSRLISAFDPKAVKGL